MDLMTFHVAPTFHFKRLPFASTFRGEVMITVAKMVLSQKLGPAGAAVHTCVVVVQKPCDIAGIEPTGCYAHYRQLPASCMCK